MKRVVLFSTFLTGKQTKILLKLIFPFDLDNKILAYMPGDGSNIKEKYVEGWQGFAKNYDSQFNLINNSKKDSKEEISKVLNSNILVITGGNTFKLLHNLRKSGLDKAIQEFIKKDNFVLSGFSAGAIVLTPTIDVCNLPDYDINDVDLKDLNGLDIIDFEVFPHYSDKYKKDLEKYRDMAKHEVKEIADEDYVVLEL